MASPDSSRLSRAGTESRLDGEDRLGSLGRRLLCKACSLGVGTESAG